MNILFLSRDYPPHLIGGVGIYVLEMSRLLAGNGHNVFVITGSNDNDSEYVDKGVRIFMVRPKRFKFLDPLRDKIGGFIERLEYSWAVSNKIKEIVNRFDINVIESCEARAEGFWYFLFNRKPPLIIKLHTPESIVFKLDNVRKTINFKLVELLEHWWIERADKVIGLTDAVIRLTTDYFKLNRNHFKKVLNPIDINYFTPLKKIIPKEHKIVLYAGRLEFRKGVHVLVKAIPYVLKKIPDVKFIFVGSDCGMKPYLLKKLTESNCLNNVIFQENIPREDIVNFYHKADVTVIPSLWENHPYVCLEAMACGNAVIAGNAGGLKEIVNDKNGILVKPGSFKELADKIILVLENDALKANLGVSARRFMEDNYNPEKTLKETTDVYQGLVKKKNG